MSVLKRMVVAMAFVWVVAPGGASAQQPTPPTPVQPSAVQQSPVEQQDEFVPISELPPQDQLPAAPLLISAYAVVMLALFFYLLSVARRLTHAQRDLARLEADVTRGGRT